MHYSPWGCSIGHDRATNIHTPGGWFRLNKHHTFTGSSDICLFSKNTAVDTHQVLRNNLGAEGHEMPVGTRSAF